MNNVRLGYIDYALATVEADSNAGAIIHMACAPNNRPGIGLEGIIDGTANVILVGEKRINVRNIGTYPGDDNESWMAGWDQDVVRYTTRKPLPDPITGDGNLRFGASHPATFNVVMCDGAVKGLSYRIDSVDVNARPEAITGTNPAPYLNGTLFNRLGCRNDGLPGEPPN